MNTCAHWLSTCSGCLREVGAAVATIRLFAHRTTVRRQPIEKPAFDLSGVWGWHLRFI